MSLLILSSLLAVALAQPVDLPLQATATCPAQGVCRIPMPPAMTAGGGLYALHDAQGHLVPAVRLTGAEAPDRWTAIPVEVDPGLRRTVLPLTEPAASVRIHVDAPPPGATVQLRTRLAPDAGWLTGPRQPRLATTVLSLPAPRLSDIEVLTSERVRVRAAEAGLVSADRYTPGAVRSLGEGWWEVELTEAAPVEQLVLEGQPDGIVEVHVWDDLRDGVLHPRLLGRLDVRDASVAGLGGIAVRHLLVRTTPEVTLTRARAWAPPAILLVRDAGEMTLYGGGMGEPHEPLRTSTEALLALPWAVGAVGPLQASPAAAESGVAPLLAPGAAIEPQRFLYRRTLSHGTAIGGLTLTPLPAEVLLRVREDLGDLRILDDTDRQVPFVVVASPGWQAVPEVTPAVRSDGGETHIRIPLPRPGLSGLRVVLESRSRGFARTVSLNTDGQERERKVWRSEEALVFLISDPLGDDVEIVVHNGDDPPIPVTTQVEVPQLALLSRPPAAGPVWLVYGDRAVQPQEKGSRLGRRRRPRLQPIPAPRYDLRSVADELLRSATAEGQLGPPADILIGGEAGDQRNIVLLATAATSAVLLILLARALLLTPRRDGEG